MKLITYISYYIIGSIFSILTVSAVIAVICETVAAQYVVLVSMLSFTGIFTLCIVMIHNTVEILIDVKYPQED